MYKIGIDFGGTKIAAGIVDENNSILIKDYTPTLRGRDAELIAADTAELVFRLLEKQNISRDEISSLGVGIPGTVENGIITDANNIGFVNVPYRDMLMEKTGFDVHLLNDARAAAKGEYFAGCGEQAASFFMITLGTGIGSAYIVNGKIVEGCNGAASEAGHMVIVKDGRPCSCGRNGCFETYASTTALVTAAREGAASYSNSLLNHMSGNVPDEYLGKLFFDALSEGDIACQLIYEEYLDYLALGIVNIINLLQPDVFAIGGGISGAGNVLLDPLKERIYPSLISRHSSCQTDIRIASLGNDAGIIGAAL